MEITLEDIDIQNGGKLRLLKYKADTPIDYDLSIFTAPEKERFLTFKSEKRQAEFYYTRVLWKSFGIDQNIEYDDFNRPILRNGFISISHSRDIVLIGFHPTHAIGVDAEYQSPKIELIQHKFISSKDLDLIPQKNSLNLTLVWSIKEAVYKMERIEGLLFKEHIQVKLLPNLAEVSVIKGNEHHRYEFGFVVREGFVISYCCHADLNGKVIF